MSWPSLSVVIASGAEHEEFLLRTLHAVVPQAEAHDAEVIVVDRCGPERQARVAEEFPGVKILAPEMDHRPSVPELRAVGFEEATGDVVAVCEEHTRPCEGWLDIVAENFRETDAAIGGPILDDDFTRARDWVVYFSEYHNYLPPWPDGEYDALNGVNIAYDREKVLRHRDVLGTGWWEAGLFPLLRKEGAFRSIPSMGAYHMGPFDYGYYMEQRFLLSRVWGATQRARVRMGNRLVHILAAPIFPIFLLARIASRVRGKDRLTGKFFKALPLLIPVVLAYTWGEFLGYLLGPGDALERVE